MTFHRHLPGSGRRCAGFTMVEIALCLAIIGFALVAIIGVLPTGLNVQKDNREETIINQDAAIWMDAIRNGGQGCDYLTNYVLVITNFVWAYEWDEGNFRYALNRNRSWTDVFTPTNWLRNGGPVTGNDSVLTNGLHIVGILSKPKVEWEYDPDHDDPYFRFYRNLVVAHVRSISGAAVERAPQTNAVVLNNAFSYRLVAQLEHHLPYDTNLIRARVIDRDVPYDSSKIPEYIPATGYHLYRPFDPELPDVNTNNTPLNVAEFPQEYWDKVRESRRLCGLAYTNSHDLRLLFRWPLRPNGSVGLGRYTARALTGGTMLQLVDRSIPNNPVTLYFLQPATYASQPIR